TANGLAKSFGPVDIFSDITLSIPHRGRMGLVGPNGVGKTTLLRILLGEEEPSAGEVQYARGLRMAYLPQEARLLTDRTLWQECLTVFADLIERQSELARLESAMAIPAEAETALAVYGRLQEEFERLGGYTFETRIRQTLTGLGFGRSDINRPLKHLSGGQRTRALLAKLLLSNPDLLLLDEPTNHLDISAVEWLENYLKDWPGAVLIVSHDRYFLDQVVDTVLEMTPTLETYHGNYSAYLVQREERYQRRLEEYQAQQEFIEKEEDYIRRNIAGQNTRQAQGRRTRLERMLEEVRLAPPRQARKLRFRLQAVSRSGDLVLRTAALSVGYQDEGRPLFHAPDLLLKRGECAAVIGPNGAGKTTFLKTLLEQVPPFSGEVRLGASLKIGYFAQAHEGLRSDHTLVEEINKVAPHLLPAEVRDYLAKFLFTGDDVFKEVKLLSGGERGRLALAQLALQGTNLLLLDEPTNHLDLPSQELLQSLLGDYQGTILLVSHDRYLIDALATQVWEVEPAQRSLRVFAGTYSEYRAARQAEALQAAAGKAAAQAQKIEREHPRSANSGVERKRREKLRVMEAEIADLEAQIAVVSRQLENPPGDPDKVVQLGRDYQNLQHDLETRLSEWAELAEE
ncbi:MAG TPA: ABC-F family ATP-binding cassette domain-containing protein, partial [Bellilinea sp.]|nr:ABC-F family ATP-binding cassette domain-containing protein [Bellilinea sp.]